MFNFLDSSEMRWYRFPGFGALRNNVAGIASNDRAENCASNSAQLNTRTSRFRRLRRPVTECDVTYFMSHHASHLAFRMRGFNHAPIDKHRAAGKRKGIDIACVDHAELIAEFCVIEFGRNR